MNGVGVLIFVVTYGLVSARRLAWLGLDRPAAALLGAVAYVAVGVLTPDQALAAIDGSTLLLLLGVMGMGAFLVVDGFFDAVEARLSRLLDRPHALLAVVVWGAGILSAFLTNDAVCLLGAPLVVRLVRRGALPPLPFLLALSTAANTGSAATLVGNPQNMLVGQLGGVSYLDYVLLAGPISVVALAINHAVVWFLFRSVLRAARGPVPSAGSTNGTERAVPSLARQRITLGVVLATVVFYSAGASLAWTAAGGMVALMLIHRRDTSAMWRHIDGSLLLFFAGLFVVVEGLRESGATEWLFDAFPLADVEAWGGVAGLATLFALGSNFVSNVPFILVVHEQMATLRDPAGAWALLAIASTFAGNLTLLGSAANVIVAEASREVGGFGFVAHLKVGLPVAVLTTLVATAWIAWWGAPPVG